MFPEDREMYWRHMDLGERGRACWCVGHVLQCLRLLAAPDFLSSELCSRPSVAGGKTF